MHPASTVHSNGFVAFLAFVLELFTFLLLLLQPLVALVALILRASAASTELTSEQSVVGSLVGAVWMVGLCHGYIVESENSER